MGQRARRPTAMASARDRSGAAPTRVRGVRRAWQERGWPRRRRPQPDGRRPALRGRGHARRAPARPVQEAAPGVITSAANEKLKLVRKLQSERWREKLGLFVAEGEDLVEAAQAAGIE